MKHIGVGCDIHPSVTLTSESYYIGDYTMIGPGVKIIAEHFCVGDYSKIHNGVFIYTQPGLFPQGRVLLGHNTWIGQNSIIDGTGGLVAGNNLGVGIASHLYSHISHGDTLEGCNWHSSKPMTIGHDVWFVGFCLVSPITAEDKSMACLGSVITKDMGYNRIYGGSPAKDLTDRLPAPFANVSVEQKTASLAAAFDDVFKSAPHAIEIDVRTRTYKKTHSPQELKFMRHMQCWRGRFTPLDEPVEDLHRAVMA